MSPHHDWLMSILIASTGSLDHLHQWHVPHVQPPAVGSVLISMLPQYLHDLMPACLNSTVLDCNQATGRC